MIFDQLYEDDLGMLKKELEKQIGKVGLPLGDLSLRQSEPGWLEVTAVVLSDPVFESNCDADHYHVRIEVRMFDENPDGECQLKWGRIWLLPTEICR